MRKVLLFTPLFPPYRGGGPNYYATLVNHLADECSLVVLTSYHPDRPLRQTENDVPIYRVVPRVRSLPRVFRGLIEPLAALIAVIVLAIRHRIRIVHSHSTSLAALGVALGAYLLSLPILYDCRDEGFPCPLVQFGKTPIWFSCAENISDQLTDCGVHPDLIIHTPVTNPEYVREYIDKSDTSGELSTITYVGRLREEKGVRLLLEIFEEYASQVDRGRLKLIGDGPLRDELAARVNASDVAERVTMVGEVSHRDAVKHIAESDVLVLPSASEGTPRVVIEAMEVGTPVVVTPVGTVGDIVNHRENGLIVDRSADELRDALLQLAKSQSLLDTLSEGAETTELEPNWTDVTESVLAGYDFAEASR